MQPSKKLKISSMELALCIEFLISREPIKAGMRLKSCIDLGTILGISHMSVQRAMKMLIDKGFLESKNGSGTFVRKIPQTVGEVPPKFSALLDADDLLAPLDDHKGSGSGRRPQNIRPLRIAVWCDVVLLNKASRLMIKGAKDYLRALGHVLDVKNIVTMNFGRDEDLHKNEDGVISLYMPQDDIERMLKSVTLPIVFIHAEYQLPLSVASQLLYLDVGETMERAIRLLVNSGARSIAVFSSDRDENIPLIEAHCRFMEQRLNIRAHLCRVPASIDEQVLETLVARIASPECRPDAIYVADDILFKFLVPLLQKYDLHPGKNIALITLSNKGIDLPGERNWSRLEFNPERLGAMAAETILNKINCASYEIISFSHLAKWIPGDTHQRAVALIEKQK